MVSDLGSVTVQLIRNAMNDEGTHFLGNQLQDAIVCTPLNMKSDNVLVKTDIRTQRLGSMKSEDQQQAQ